MVSLACLLLGGRLRKKRGGGRGEKEWINVLAWIMYMAPMAPPALLNIQSSSRLT